MPYLAYDCMLIWAFGIEIPVLDLRSKLQLRKSFFEQESISFSHKIARTLNLLQSLIEHHRHEASTILFPLHTDQPDKRLRTYRYSISEDEVV